MDEYISKLDILYKFTKEYYEDESIPLCKLYNYINNCAVKERITFFYPAMDGDGIVCKACGNDIPLHSIPNFYHLKYCPNCGAFILNQKELIKKD